VSTPAFSIICPDYHGVVSHSRRHAAIGSVLRQSFPDWELVVIHDGPRKEPLRDAFEDGRIRWVETDVRHNDWGHSLRHAGITIARGDYIVHLNADNVLYEHCLAILHAYSRRRERRVEVSTPTGEVAISRVNPQVLVFAARMMGCLNALQMPAFVRKPGNEWLDQLLLPGWPPQGGRIDCMQLVARRSIWQEIGGWYDRTERSDGVIFAEICRRYGYLMVPDVLGEHW